ncbi:protein tyrosine phosphatase family protein [Gammaproteobacteria bacterium]|nr:protein tyrosine phosphatase family protein [Gammaproteobacteria bacterium]
MNYKGLSQIFNYLKIGDNFSTSGQPSESDSELISKAGVQTVINLAPHNVENSPKDEAGLLQTLSIEYVHIPVDFFNLKEIDFRTFFDALNKRRGQKVWIHCAANMRVSASLFRYCTKQLGMEALQAKLDLNQTWEPFDCWKPFMSGGLRD